MNREPFGRIMTLPLRITVTTAFGLFTAAVILVVVALGYIGSRDAILENARTSISKAAHSAEDGIDSLVGRAVLTAQTVAHLPKSIFSWREPEALLVTLAVSLKSTPEIYGVFVGFPDGAFVQAVNLIGPDGNRRDVAGMPAEAATAWRVIGPAAGGRGRPERWWYFDRAGKRLAGSPRIGKENAGYDPRTRSWFRQSQAERDTIASDVYVFSSLKKPGVTISRPLDNFPQGSVGVDLSLSDLAGLTLRLRPGNGGVVAIIDDHGDVVAHPDPDSVTRPKKDGIGVGLVPAVELDDQRIQMAVAGVDKSKASHRSFTLADEEYITFFHPAPKSSVAKWHVVSVAAVSDYTGQLEATLQRSLMITIAVLLITVICVSLMAGWISRPVTRLKAMADQLTRLNFNDIAQFKSPFEEINELQTSMNRMKGALDTFLRFVPRDVVRELVQTGQAAMVGGAKREVTMLFTDVEGFTTMTERMTPEEIMSQASDYFENLSMGIQANRGTIDKFIGDAIMAMWNAPVEDPYHADNACRGALAAYHISEDLNAEFKAQGKSIMRTRFGLHTGDALVGNVGARDRMQYTCLGSSVNLAARIEGLNKFYGTQVLVSDAVRKRASNAFLFRRVDIVEAKGTTLPVTIFELMGERGEDAAFYVGPEALRRASKYEQAFDFYLHRDFQDALDILGALTEETPDDPVVALLTRKCTAYLADPPPANWNGATALDSK